MIVTGVCLLRRPCPSPFGYVAPFPFPEPLRCAASGSGDAVARVSAGINDWRAMPVSAPACWMISASAPVTPWAPFSTVNWSMCSKGDAAAATISGSFSAICCAMGRASARLGRNLYGGYGPGGRECLCSGRLVYKTAITSQPCLKGEVAGTS